jgi:hypothetical protein
MNRLALSWFAAAAIVIVTAGSAFLPVLVAGESQTIYLTVRASSWRAEPFDVVRHARSQLEEHGFKVVLDRRAGHEAVVAIEWREEPGGTFQDGRWNVVGEGTTVTSRIEITARSTGRSVAYDGLSASTPTVLGGVRTDSARDDLRDGAAHAMLRQSPWPTLGETVAKELAALAR